MFTASAQARWSSVLLGSCAVVATGAYLGMDWLKEPVLGLPTGLWLIGAVQAQAWIVARAASGVHSLSPIPAADTNDGRTMPPVLGRIAGAAWECLRIAAKSLHVPLRWFTDFEDKVSARADRMLARSQTLRIGLNAGPEFRRVVMDQATAVDIEWVTVSPASDDQATLRRHTLDALVRVASDGSASIVTLEHPEREAGWYDWATPRPLTYASVFPVRVDPAKITLESLDVTDTGQAALAAAIMRAAAAAARSPARLRLSDRLGGRAPSTRQPEGVRTPTSLLDRSMLELAGAVIEHGTSKSPAAKAAARAAGAWLASTEAWLDMSLRRAGIEAAAALLPNEPEAALRAAAVRLAMFDDDSAFAAMAEAGRQIRSGATPHIGEHLAFLQAELELGSPNPLTLGRVAAGICLVCATTTPDRVAFIRGDLMDDVRHSAWLVGREQDRAVLAEVFKLMGADQVAPGPWELRDAA